MEDKILRALELMLIDLESNQLEVILIPEKRRTHEMGFIRVAASKNCKWYREFCAKYSSDRKRKNLAFDTRIKRRNVIVLLEKMISGKEVKSKYKDEILRIAKNFKI